MDMRLHVLSIATRFKLNLPKGLLQDSNLCLATTQVGGMWGFGPAADLGRVLFETLAEVIAVVDDLNHRGCVPDSCLEEVGQGGVCLPRLIEDMPSAMSQVSAHDLDMWNEASARPDSLPRRPRLIPPANNSDDALSFTNMSVIMHMW